MSDIFQRMKHDGVTLGTIVEVSLEKNADVDHTGTSLAPWYILEKEPPFPDKRERQFIGYVCQFDDQQLGICSGWVTRENKDPYGDKGSIKFSYDAIAEFKKK